MRFDRKAENYHQKADIQKVVADWCAEWIERDCSGLRALELGAGTGLFTRHLALRAYASLLATDIAPKMLEEGRKRLPLVEWKRVDAWAFEIEAVDRLYSCSLLQWAPDPLAVLKGWAATLRPGGRFLSSLFISGSLKEFTEVDSGFAAFPWRSEEEWLELFREAGLEARRSENRSEIISFGSPREALRSLHDIGAIEERRMGSAKLRRFLRACEERSTEGFTLTWKVMRVECAKR